MQLTLEALVLGVGGFVIIGLGGGVIWFAKRERQQISGDIAEAEAHARERDDRLEKQLGELQRDVLILRESLPDRFVGKTDWSEFRGWLASTLARVERRIDGRIDGCTD